VVVAGGGLAGITAALRLAERGCRVTLYEEKDVLGGDVASRNLDGGGAIDVYPHMFQSWYRNFWKLLEDVGVDGEERKRRFTEFTSFYQLRPLEGKSLEFTKLTDAYSAGHMLENLFSGIGPPADMFVFGYAGLDLLAELLNPTVLLENMSLTGFLGSRPYMTKAAIEAYETYITRVWAVPGYLASAEDCRTYLTYCYAEPEEPSWLTKGPAAETIIAPLLAALRKQKVGVELHTRVTEVRCKEGKVQQITTESTHWNDEEHAWIAPGKPKTEPVENLVLAVPGTTLAKLVRRGRAGRRIVDFEPRLAQLSRLSSQRVPILYLAFKRKLKDMPAAPVGLFGSKLNLTFTDISKLWSNTKEFGRRTVLAVSCSEPYALAGRRPEEDGHAIMKELARYLPFSPGRKWKQSPDIDWQLTRYHPNSDAQLTLNLIGTDIWRPAASCPRIPNLFFAGDFCQHEVGLTTVEAAVASGQAAAREIVRARRLGAPVEVLKPRTLPDEVYVWLRYAWAPAVLAAKMWSMLGKPVGSPGEEEESLWRYLLTPGRPARHRAPED
jgi:hypothetical protein